MIIRFYNFSIWKKSSKNLRISFLRLHGAKVRPMKFVGKLRLFLGEESFCSERWIEKLKAPSAKKKYAIFAGLKASILLSRTSKLSGNTSEHKMSLCLSKTSA